MLLNKSFLTQDTLKCALYEAAVPSCLTEAIGVTLLEVLLVLVIISAIIVTSLMFYNSLENDKDILQLRATVDMLSEAAAQFYQANCVYGGLLNPNNVSGNIVPVDVTKSLIQPGFLNAFPNPNPLVNTSQQNVAYIVQFNQFTSPRMQPVCANPPQCTATSLVNIGTIVLWRIQVSVLANDINMLNANRGILGADCTSSLAAGQQGGNTVAPCSAGKAGPYLVFERLPSYPAVSAQALSPFWLSNPLLRQFTQMYNTLPMTFLTGSSAGHQYFYCPNGGISPSSS